MQDVFHRYTHDPVFAHLVDLIGSLLEGQDGLLFTPSELREACMLATMRYEQLHIRPTGRGYN